jgi:hypothetical protein
MGEQPQLWWLPNDEVYTNRATQGVPPTLTEAIWVERLVL